MGVRRQGFGGLRRNHGTRKHEIKQEATMTSVQHCCLLYRGDSPSREVLLLTRKKFNGDLLHQVTWRPDYRLAQRHWSNHNLARNRDFTVANPQARSESSMPEGWQPMMCNL